MSSDPTGEQLDLVGVTEQCGLLLQLSGCESNRLRCSSAEFIHNLSGRLSAADGSSHAKWCDQYVEQLEDEVFSQPLRLEQALAPLVVQREESNNQWQSSGSDGSYLRVLLGVPALQPSVMKRLVDKLVELDENPELQQTFHIDVQAAIFSTIRYLEYPVDTDSICRHVCKAVVRLKESPLQRQLISILRDTINVNQHDCAALQLRDLLQSTPIGLMDSVLEVLDYLQLSEKVFVQLHETVLKLLVEVPTTMFPVIIRFFLRSGTVETGGLVMTSIRDNLQMEDMTAVRQTSTARRSAATTSTASVHVASADRFSICNGQSSAEVSCAVFATIKQELGGSTFLAKAAYDHLCRLCSSGGRLTLFDLWLILILRMLKMIEESVVDTLLRNFVTRGSLTCHVIDKSFQRQHLQVAEQLFEQWMELAMVLTTANKGCAYEIPACIYRHCFVTLDDGKRQRALRQLIDHLGSQWDQEIDFALNLLSQLVEKHHRKMLRFCSEFIPHMFIIMQQLLKGQWAARLVQVFSSLAYSAHADGQIAQDHLLMCCHECISCGREPERSTGIVCGVGLVEDLLCHRTSKEDTRDDIKCLLQVLNDATKCPAARAQLYDRLADMCLVEGIDTDLLAVVVEPIQEEFWNHCILETEHDSFTQMSDYEMLYSLTSLDGNTVEPICVNILSNVYDYICDYGFNDNVDSNFVAATSPAFRLFLNCEKRIWHSLDHVSPVLDAPLLLSKLRGFTELPRGRSDCKRLACLTAYHGCNWLREVVNGLSSVGHRNALRRLRHLVELHSLLERAVEDLPSSTVPSTHFDIDAAAGGGGGGGGGGRTHWMVKMGSEGLCHGTTIGEMWRKLTRRGNRPSTVLAKTATATPATPAETVGAVVQVEVKMGANNSMDTERPYEVVEHNLIDKGCGKWTHGLPLVDHLDIFRELDIDCLNLLRYPVSSGTEEVAIDGELKPRELDFLLFDLEYKLVHVVGATAYGTNVSLLDKMERGGRFDHLEAMPRGTVISKLFDCVGLLRLHFDRICDYLADTAVTKDSGSAAAQVELYSQKSLAMVDSLQTMVSCVTLALSWIGFHQEENRHQLLRLMSFLAGKEGVVDGISGNRIIKEFFRLLEKVKDFAVDWEFAHCFLRLMTVVAGFDWTPDVRKTSIVHWADDFLKKFEWRSADSLVDVGAQFNQFIRLGIRIRCVTYVPRLMSLASFANESIVTASLTDELVSQSYKSLTAATFPVYFKSILAELLRASVTGTSGTAPAATQTTSAVEDEEYKKFMKWVVSLKIFDQLVNVCKKLPANSSSVVEIIRSARKYLNLLVDDLMSVLNGFLSTDKRTETVTFFNKLWHVTADVGDLCALYKIPTLTDRVISRYIPRFEETREELVDRLQYCFAANKCHDTLWHNWFYWRDLKEAVDWKQEDESSVEGDEEVSESSDDDDNDV